MVSFVVTSFDTRNRETKNRLPATGGGQLFTVENFLFISALAEITSS
jgi:hypothetical protein